MLLDQMHIALRERDRDAFLVEAFLHRARDVPVHRPVVTGPGPGTYHEVDRGFAQGVQPDHRLGLGEHQLVAFDDVPQHAFGVIDIVPVGDAEDHVDASVWFGRDVADHIAPDLAVGHDQYLVIHGCYGGRDQAHFLHEAHRARDLDTTALGAAQLAGLSVGALAGSSTFSAGFASMGAGNSNGSPPTICPWTRSSSSTNGVDRGTGRSCPTHSI